MPVVLPAMVLASITATSAAPIEPDWGIDVNWENTVKLGTILQPTSPYRNANPYCLPADRGTIDRHVIAKYVCGGASGLTSGRLDWRSALDLADGDLGGHVSLSGWYDRVNDRPGADNRADNSEGGGRGLEIFEAFVHDRFDMGGDRPLSVRLGRYSLIWGESLYFSENAIAAGMAPQNSYRTRLTQSYQTTDIFLPVGQASLSWQAVPEWTVEAYYQFEWRRSRINPEDAYIGPNDVLGADGNHVIALGGPRIAYYDRGLDQTSHSRDQYGLAMKWRHGGTDYGLYAISFDAKEPTIYYRLGTTPYDPAQGTYSLVYPKAIQAFGASLNGTYGDSTFGGEISGRRNMPLVNQGIVVRLALAATADNDRHPLYPLGNTLHAQLSWITPLPPSALLPGGATWSSEIAANRLLDITANSSGLSPGTTGTAAAIRSVFEPQFFQLLPRLDVTMPIALGLTLFGTSAVDRTMQRGTGDISIGATASLDRLWKATLTATHYFGRSKNGASPFTTASAEPLSDWDFIGATIQRSF